MRRIDDPGASGRVPPPFGALTGAIVAGSLAFACAPDARLETLAAGGAASSAGGGGAGGSATDGGTGGTGGTLVGGGGSGGGGATPGPGELAWAQAWTTKQAAHITAVACAPNGDILVGGSFTGELRLGDELLEGASAYFDAFLARLTADGSVLWAQKWGTDSVFEQIWDIAVDDASIVVVGSVAAGMTSPPSPPLSTFIAGEPLTWNDELLDTVSLTYVGEMYVVKLTASGELEWLLDPPEPEAPAVGAPRQAYSVDLAPNGDVVVAGRIHESGRVHPDGNAIVMLPPARPQAFVVALDGDSGGHLWTTPLPRAENSTAHPIAEPRHLSAHAAVSAGGQVLAGLAYQGKIEVQGSASAPQTLDAEGIDSVGLSLNLATGSITAFLRYQGAKSQALSRVATAGSRLYVGGSFEQELRVSGALLYEQEVADDSDAFVLQYALPIAQNNQAHEEQHLFVGQGHQQLWGLEADAAGVAARLEFTGTLVLNQTPFGTQGGIDTLVVALSPLVSPRWGLQIGGPGDDVMGTIGLHPDGLIVVGGKFSDSLWIGDMQQLVADGDPDAFLATLWR